MTTPPPGDRSHLERLINTWARELETGTATAGRLRYYIAFCVIATALEQSATEPDPLIVIKGGAALQLRFGLSARVSKDLDATTQHDLADTVAVVADRLREGWQGFTATLTDPVPIRGARTPAPPLRCTIKLAYKAKPFVSIPFELALAEPSVLTDVDALTPAQSLDPVRLTASTSIPVMGVHHQIAQKLHACTETPLEGENTRVRDLYDIILISPSPATPDCTTPAEHASRSSPIGTNTRGLRPSPNGRPGRCCGKESTPPPQSACTTR